MVYKICKTTATPRLIKSSVRPFEQRFNHRKSNTDGLGPLTYSSTCQKKSHVPIRPLPSTSQKQQTTKSTSELKYTEFQGQKMSSSEVIARGK